MIISDPKTRVVLGIPLLRKKWPSLKIIKKLRSQYEKYIRPDHEIEWIGLPLPLALKKQYEIEVANGNPRYTDSTPLIDLYRLQEQDEKFDA